MDWEGDVGVVWLLSVAAAWSGVTSSSIQVTLHTTPGKGKRHAMAASGAQNWVSSVCSEGGTLHHWLWFAV